MGCKNCGVRIIQIDMPEGKTWVHQPEALLKDFYVYCRLNLAEPRPEPCSTCQGNGGFLLPNSEGHTSVYEFCPGCGKADPMIKSVRE